MAKFRSYLPLAAIILSPAGAAPSCKAVPGGEGWPSPEQWAALNQSVDGRLLQPTPPGAICHPGHAAYNAAACPATQAAWFTEPLHANDPVSSMWNNWNNDTCLPDPALTCSSAGYPVYVVNASTAQHVKAGVDFARRHNIRLIVKNSGHDYLGRSSAPNSLSIWVHHMKGIMMHPDSFRPVGCNVTVPGHAITAAAGTQMLEAYRATAPHNRTVVGGNGRTVALGGFVTGGGHSILAPHFGMAADRVLQMELVTPAGDVVTANECQNTDLFWAMRGGGGSTFGILTSLTIQTIPSPAVANLDFSFATPSSNPRALDAIAYFLGRLPSLGDAGISGYPILFRASPDPLNSSQTLAGVVGTLITLHTLDTSHILSHMTPLFAHINATFRGSDRDAFPFTFSTKTTAYPSFAAWYEEHYDPSPVGYGSVMASRLLDPAALGRNLTATREAFDAFSAGAGFATAYIVSGKGVWEARPRGGRGAMNPAWRRAVVHATASFAIPPLDPAARALAVAGAGAAAAALRELAPDMGAYVNEANRYEPDWQRTFWGDNYERLLRIKRAVDPDDVLWCQPCVGSERWEEVDDRLCRV